MRTVFWRFHDAATAGNSVILQEDQNLKLLYKTKKLENARPLQETANNNNEPRLGRQAALRDLSKCLRKKATARRRERRAEVQHLQQ